MSSTRPTATTVHRSGRSPAFAELVDLLRARPVSPEKSVEQARADYEALAARYSDPPAVERRAVMAGGVPAEWSTPPGTGETSSAILLLHGGGYTLGSIAAYRDLAARLAHLTGAAVLTIEYRLAPEHLFPAAVDDAVSAYRWMRDRLPAGTPVAVVGDSAGGGLAVSVMVAAHDAQLPLPEAAAVFSPRTDLVQTGASVDTQAHLDPLVSPASSLQNGLRYLGPDGDPRHPLASPLFADLTGLPPVFIYVGTAEILLDDSLRLARELRRAGVAVDLDVWPEGIHILPFFAARVPEAAEALDNAAAFLRRHLSTGARR
jgi:epsilon-lactone hydrolase